MFQEVPGVFDDLAGDRFVVHGQCDLFIQGDSVVNFVLPSQLAFFKGVVSVLYGMLTAQGPDQMG